MSFSKTKASLIKSALAASFLLAASASALAQTSVTLTATPYPAAAMSDGQAVPMWGYACSTTTVPGGGATCTAANGLPQTPGVWQPPLIKVPSGQPLTITLINALHFSNNPPANTAFNDVPTSLVIVGQVGGGLGDVTQRTTIPSPAHAVQGTTWPGTPGTVGTGDPEFTPPAQPNRVRSMATEVNFSDAAGKPLLWSTPRPGTYLIESGTEPSIQGAMGLYGVLIVTDANYPGQTFDADLALLLSEVDPVQNLAVQQAVQTPGFDETLAWNGQTGHCGDPTIHTCYPPAVNYSPLYYLVNGVGFDRSNPGASALTVAAAGPQTRVLLSFVNAGLRMHVPSVVGANMTLLAEDGNKLPGVPKVQSEVLLPAGKTYDVTIQPKQTTAGTYDAATIPVFDRQLSLSTDNQHDGGMQVYINVAGGAATGVGSSASTVGATANADAYFVTTGNTLTVSDPARGLIGNDVGIYGVAPFGTVAGLNLNPNGTFTYTGAASSFVYCGNGDTSGVTSGVAPRCATVTLSACTSAPCNAGPPTANPDSYASKVAARFHVSPPGVLENDTDPNHLQLHACADATCTVGAAVSAGGGTVTLNPDGSFTATPGTAPTAALPQTVTFTYFAVNSQNTAASGTASVTFTAGNGHTFTVRDAKDGSAITDYRWIIEEDRTTYIDPNVETASATTPPLNLAVNFHTSHLPVVAQGCTGDVSCEAGQSLLGAPAICDLGNGVCRPGAHKVITTPDQVVLDPTKRYYISILPGDGADGGHGMGGTTIASGQALVNVNLQPLPYPTAKISVFVFEDDMPLNGEQDTGGGVDVLAPNEPGLEGFNIVLLDQTGQFGDPAGQLTYDEFGQPVSNALAGTIDPVTGLDACPVSATATDGLVGVIVTCPKYEAGVDGSGNQVLSPLAGHAVIANMYPGLYEVHTTPGADRTARGEEWLQTNTLDGTKDIEAFIKPDEPSYFQEFGPGGYHVAVGFANPRIINDRKAGVCAAGGCTATINGIITNMRMSRTPDQRVYGSGTYDSLSFGQCYVSLGSPDGADYAFTKCNPDGTFQFTQIPHGDLKLTVFDQWNDILVDGLSTPIRVGTDTIGTPAAPLEIPVTQWRTNLYGRIFLDRNGDNASQPDEPGLPLVPYNIRYRDGSYMGFNNTDLNGYAGFNEVFPFLNWMVVDTDSARYKQTGVHVVYDSGGPVDGGTDCLATTPPSCGNSEIAAAMANTVESSTAHLPTELRVPGARYCQGADCPAGDTAGGSTGRVDPGYVPSEGWQGLLGQNSFVEFAMRPFASASGTTPAENGGIRGHVIYTSTRPFDDPALLLQLSWEPGVESVKINLYQEGVAPDGTRSLTLVDTTTTSSWDDWAQGFRVNANGAVVNGADGQAIPNMSCPGQETTSPFYYTMRNSTMGLHPATAISSAGRFKCYDGWSMLNQVQPAPYNGMYKFPSVVAKASGPLGAPGTLPLATDAPILQFDPKTYKTNCTICIPNHSVPTTDPAYGTPMLPEGKYVVEVVVPDNYELVKEEDKNILLGDAYIAPATTQFAGFGNIFIVPDQAAVGTSYNPNNPIQATSDNGAAPRHEGDTGSVEVFWPCVGTVRQVPDFNSEFPGAGQQAPFAGAMRPLCDRKEVTLEGEMTALAKFYVFTSAHIAGHYTGTITNDFASELDPFSPQFGEKFAPPNMPVAIKDFTGKEVSRTYSDQWGLFNGATYSTWTVNPPSPSGYIPMMMLACMNDPGPILDTRATVDGVANPTFNTMITDPQYNPGYSNFCYEIPFMPGQTAYLDTPVIPTMAFAAGYNLPDCDYPDTTPAIKSVLGTAINGGQGPWVSAAGQPLTINALGDKPVLNHAYAGPQASTAPYNKKFITRHYGFGVTGGTVGLVGSDGVFRALTGVAWADGQISGTVPSGVPACAVQQRNTPTAQCGELVVTAANGKQSVDTVTVTIGGKVPTYVTPNSPSTDGSHGYFGRIAPSPLQSAIDAAAPGDLLIIGPGTYNENLLLWKPLRLQGVGAESVFINADAHPAGKMDPWRRQVDCLFGLSVRGRPLLNDGSFPADTYDGTGTWTCPADMQQRVDRIHFEAIVGWDAAGNGNLAQMLQEPTLMGAYEGAGITVVGRGVKIPANSTDFWGAANAGGFPAGYEYLTTADCGSASASTRNGRDYGSSNFLCNPSRIDGVSIINSSQGGGAIFAHGWNHNLEIANTRIHGNHGTLTGGITIGNGEFPDPYLVGGDTPPVPGQPANGLINGEQAGYGFNRNVNLHHNAVTANLSVGDALYSGTPSAAGGVTFCSGSDSYKFNYNWICGNMSGGDAGGVAHVGFTNDGTIAHNWILFNQSQNPTIPTNGGGLAVLGASPDRMLPDGTECGGVTDQDCPPGLPEGTGRNLLIDANLILGNSAESGTGGGLRLQMVNGLDVIGLPGTPSRWNDVTVTNNIIANNVAGWDGAGVSMQDAFKVKFVNNTVVANDATASAGVLFNTLGAALAATPPPNCNPGSDPNASCQGTTNTSTDQPSGFVTMRNTPNMVTEMAALPGGTNSVICPSGYGYTTGSGGNQCRQISLPLLTNDLFYQNRSFHIGVAPLLASGTQQKVVTLYPTLDQGVVTGTCPASGTADPATSTPPNNSASTVYWDLGVRGDTSTTPNSGSGFTLAPQYSVLTNVALYPPANNFSGGSNPSALVIKEYCNGARIPPEHCAGVDPNDTIAQAQCRGFHVPPGHSESTGLYPVFALAGIAPAATVDEGNNWINLTFGPLSLSNASQYAAKNTLLPPLGNYGLPSGSVAIDKIPVSAASGSPYQQAPTFDFFSVRRKGSGVTTPIDIGAVEFAGTATPQLAASVSPTTLSFGNWATGTTSTTQNVTVTNTGNTALAGGSFTFSTPTPFTRVTGGTFPAGAPNCAATLAVAASCTLKVQFAPTVTGAVSRTLTVAYTGATVTGSPVTLTGTGVATRAGVSITPNPATITLPTLTGCTTAACISGTTIVTLTNTAGAGGSQVAVTNVSVPLGGSLITWFFNLDAQTCTAAPLAPGGTCTATVRFSNPNLLGGAPRGVNRNGTITFTDTGAASPQTGALVGHANP
jgi:hypothetical protein